MSENKIKSWFHYYSTKEVFNLHLNNGLINPNSICFIGETSQIYAQGKFFGMDCADFSAALNLLNEHEKSLKNMLGVEGESVDSEGIDNFKEVIEFLKGIANDATLLGIIDKIQSEFNSNISSLEKRFVNKIDNTKANLESGILEIKHNVEDLNNRVSENTSSINALNSLSSLPEDVRKIKNDFENYKILNPNPCKTIIFRDKTYNVDNEGTIKILDNSGSGNIKKFMYSTNVMVDSTGVTNGDYLDYNHGLSCTLDRNLGNVITIKHPNGQVHNVVVSLVVPGPNQTLLKFPYDFEYYTINPTSPAEAITYVQAYEYIIENGKIKKQPIQIPGDLEYWVTISVIVSNP